MTFADLEWNRRGLLSPQQREAIQAHVFSFGTSRWVSPLSLYVEAWERDLVEGQIISVDGAVVFDYQTVRDSTSALPPGHRPDPGGSGYWAEFIDSAGRRIRYSLAPWLDTLLPGPYRLYLASHSGFLVEAESIAAAPEVHQTALYQVILEAQNVTEATLAENRCGRMTAAQRKEESARPCRPSKGTVPALALVGLVLLACQSVALLKNLAGGTAPFAFGGSQLGGLALGAVFFGTAVILFLFRQWGRLTTVSDANQGIVTCIEAPMTWKNGVFLHQGRVKREVRVGNHSFDLTRQGALFAALVKGPIYRVYLSPRSRRLLSIEPIRS